MQVLWLFCLGGRMLRLMQVKMEDAGHYICVVTNIAGEVRKYFELSVLGEYVKLIFKKPKYQIFLPSILYSPCVSKLKTRLKK